MAVAISYLTYDEVVAIHDAESSAPLNSPHLLDSAVNRPQQSAFGEDAYPTIHLKAAALMESLNMNQPFSDGNKRTSVLATIAFYNLNGYIFDAPNEDLYQLADAMSVDEHTERPTLEFVADRLAEWIREIPDPRE